MQYDLLPWIPVLAATAIGAAPVLRNAVGSRQLYFRRQHRQVRIQASASQATATNVNFNVGMGNAAAAMIGKNMEVILVPCLSDNYAPIIHDVGTGATAVVDTPEVEPILAACEKRGWKLTHILNTHHHHDHTGGNSELKRKTACKIIGPAGEASRITEIDEAVTDGQDVCVGSLQARVLEIGGHTAGHIGYHFEKQHAAFVGDALFALGCGRVFEGTAEQMWASLQKIRSLPDETVVYCAHEYTESNARFASHLGGIPQLADRVAVVRALRSAGEPTVPMLLGHEKLTNPFLLADSEALRVAAGLSEGATPVQVFAEVRRQKDHF